jgi:HD-like signal output (HDOD) protein/anti-anti-sigma regulatory factor
MSKKGVIAGYIKNDQERTVLSVLFETYGYTFVPLQKLQSAFMEIMHHSPDYLIFEITDNFTPQVTTIKQLLSNRKTRGIPLICYGDPQEETTGNILRNSGIKTYYERPLQTDMIHRVITPHSAQTQNAPAKDTEKYAGELEDATRIMDRKTPPMERIDIMVRRIGDLLAFPFTIAKVMQVTENEKTGAKDLARSIETDSVVVSNVLKVANSVAYGRAGSKISSIRDAIVRIGFKETKKIALSLSVMGLFSEEERSVGFSREHFWLHSLATAVIAQKLAKKSRGIPEEKAFICGLMHDFGIILLDEFFPSFMLMSLQKTNEQGTSFITVQEKLWGMSHVDVVVRLFSEWNMPDEIAEVMKKLNTFHTYEGKNNDSVTDLIHLVGLAEVMAKSISFGRECDEYVVPTPDSFLKKCGLTQPLRQDFFDSIAQELSHFASYMGISDIQVGAMNEDDAALETSFALVDKKSSLFSPFEYSLLMQKTPCDRATTPDEITGATTEPDAVIVHSDNEWDDSQRKAWCNLASRRNDRDTVPVVFIDGGDISLPPRDHLTLIPEEIDLRIFSFALENLTMGYPFAFEVEEIPEPEYAAPVKKDTFSYAARVLESSVILLQLSGTIRQKNKETLHRMIVLLSKKTPYIALDFTGADEIDKPLLPELETLIHDLSEKNIRVLLTGFSPIEKKQLPEDILQKLHIFAEESQLVAELKK